MSLLTQIIIAEKYGPLITEVQLAELLHTDAGTLRNQRSRGELGIPMSRRGKTPMYHAADVAAYIDGLRSDS